MKSMVSSPVLAAVLIAASFGGTPCAAMPMARLSAASPETAPIKVNGVRVLHRHRHHYRYRPLLYVGPGLYYGCRPGWYCFGPPYRPGFRRAWYGGFNSQFGYQGGRYRAQPRVANTGGTSPPVAAPPDQDTAPSQ